MTQVKKPAGISRGGPILQHRGAALANAVFSRSMTKSSSFFGRGHILAHIPVFMGTTKGPPACCAAPGGGTPPAARNAGCIPGARGCDTPSGVTDIGDPLGYGRATGNAG